MSKIDFEDIRNANMTRCIEWMGALPSPQNIAFHGLELGGEAGEAQNICKKIARYYMDGIPGYLHPDLATPMLAEELADVIICVDMIAATLNIDLAEAVKDKFNATSDKHGFKTHLLPEK